MSDLTQGPDDDTIRAYELDVADCCERMANYLRTPRQHRTPEQAQHVGVRTILQEIVNGWSLS